MNTGLRAGVRLLLATHRKKRKKSVMWPVLTLESSIERQHEKAPFYDQMMASWNVIRKRDMVNVRMCVPRVSICDSSYSESFINVRQVIAVKCIITKCNLWIDFFSWCFSPLGEFSSAIFADEKEFSSVDLSEEKKTNLC